jgi:hypothetical protein
MQIQDLVSEAVINSLNKVAFGTLTCTCIDPFLGDLCEACELENDIKAHNQGAANYGNT